MFFSTFYIRHLVVVWLWQSHQMIRNWTCWMRSGNQLLSWRMLGWVIDYAYKYFNICTLQIFLKNREHKPYLLFFTWENIWTLSVFKKGGHHSYFSLGKIFAYYQYLKKRIRILISFYWEKIFTILPVFLKGCINLSYYLEGLMSECQNEHFFILVKLIKHNLFGIKFALLIYQS